MGKYVAHGLKKHRVFMDGVEVVSPHWEVSPIMDTNRAVLQTWDSRYQLTDEVEVILVKYVDCNDAGGSDLWLATVEEE